jgi:hypothetical protein
LYIIQIIKLKILGLNLLNTLLNEFVFGQVNNYSYYVENKNNQIKKKFKFKFKFFFNFSYSYNCLKIKTVNIINCKRYYSISLKAKSQIMVFDRFYFIIQFVYYFFYFLYTGNVNNLFILLTYFNIFLQYIINSYFFLNSKIELNNKQKILYDSKNKINSLIDLFYYFFNLIKYYSITQHYNQLYNIKYLNFLITNIFLYLYKNNLLTVIDINTLK